MKNKEIAKIFRQISKILQIKGESPFRVRAYEKAAQSIENLQEDLQVVVRENPKRLLSLPGIGKDLAGKIKQFINTGGIQQYEELRKGIPEGVLQMTDIPGLGPKTVKAIYEKLNIDSIDKLEKAARTGKLRQLEKIKQKTEQNILQGIELLKKSGDRIPFYFALKLADEIVSQLRQVKGVKKIEIAGSLRRRKYTIGDIDILVASDNPSSVMKVFTSLETVKRVLAHGETKSSVIAGDEDIQVDLRIVESRSFGAALLYFTGSKAFNIKFRQLALRRKIRVNEYGLFSLSGKGNSQKRIAGETEEGIFSAMKMAYVPAELREDRGEVEAALERKLPDLVEARHIKGDLHLHSDYSDGFSSIEELAEAASEFGYKYIAVTDHSQVLKVAGGLEKKAVFEKIEQIKRLNRKFKNLRILCGTEVDILAKGELDYPPKILKEFDIVVAAIHTGFKQSRKQLTARVVSACKNKYVNIIAHPTGRLWGVREAYDIDLEEVFKAASDYNVAMEVNCHPRRLDLNDTQVMRARETGVKLALGTDAHSLNQFELMSLGVDIARRGWLEKEDIINCLSREELIKWLKK